MSFRKQSSCGLVGLLLKTILLLPNTGGYEILCKNFSFLTKSEIITTIKFGTELWMILKDMHESACKRS